VGAAKKVACGAREATAALCAFRPGSRDRPPNRSSRNSSLVVRIRLEIRGGWNADQNCHAEQGSFFVNERNIATAFPIASGTPIPGHISAMVHSQSGAYGKMCCHHWAAVYSLSLKRVVIHKKELNYLFTHGVTSMQAQLITYQLQDISQAEYLKQMVEPDAPILSNVKGLISKVWLADEEQNAFGGFYLWENKTAMEDFMHSELVKAIVSRPFVKNVSSVDWEVNQTASLITRGLK